MFILPCFVAIIFQYFYETVVLFLSSSQWRRTIPTCQMRRASTPLRSLSKLFQRQDGNEVGLSLLAALDYFLMDTFKVYALFLSQS
jgi:hypothetical protein